MKSLFLTLSSLLFINFSSLGQVGVQSLLGSPLTITSLADSLVGDNVQVANITYTGATDAVGRFFNGNNTIGLEKGIILSTGSLAQINSNTSSTAFANVSLGTSGDADLTTIAGAPTLDAALMEFDFSSPGDTVELQVVFASEEYPEYSCNFTDIFGFFVSGDGYNGTHSNQSVNVALVPGTTLPINPQTIRGGNTGGCPPLNASYYVENDTQAYPIIYDGFTTIITIKFAVTPDSTYHFKIGIADALDPTYDSAIFIGSKSFKANFIPTPKLLANTSFGGLTVNERCGQVDLNIVYPIPLNQNDTLELVTGGSATAGLDYGNVPNTIFGFLGDTILPTIQVPIYNENQLETNETAIFYLKRNGLILDSLIIIIEDSTALFSNWSADTSICSGDMIWLDGSLNSLPTVNYPITNNNLMAIPDGGTVTSTILVNNLPPNAVLESVCLNINHTYSQDLDIYLVAPNGQILELSTDNGGTHNPFYVNTCFSGIAALSINNVSSVATGSFLPEGNWSDLNGLVNGFWALVVMDDTLTFTGDLMDWTLNFATSNTLAYTWSHVASPNSLNCTNCITPRAIPTETTNYILNIQTLSGCVIQDSVEIAVSDLDISFNVIDDTLSNNSGSATVNVSGGILPYDIIWSTGDTTPTITGLSAGYYDCTITDAAGCLIIKTAAVSNPSSVNQLGIIDEFSIAPNPTTELVYINLSLHESIPLKVSLYNVTGQQLIEKQVSKNNNHQIKLDLSSFSNGIYLVQFQLNNETLTKRIILQR